MPTSVVGRGLGLSLGSAGKVQREIVHRWRVGFSNLTTPVLCFRIVACGVYTWVAHSSTHLGPLDMCNDCDTGGPWQFNRPFPILDRGTTSQSAQTPSRHGPETMSLIVQGPATRCRLHDVCQTMCPCATPSVKEDNAFSQFSMVAVLFPISIPSTAPEHHTNHKPRPTRNHQTTSQKKTGQPQPQNSSARWRATPRLAFPTCTMTTSSGPSARPTLRRTASTAMSMSRDTCRVSGRERESEREKSRDIGEREKASQRFRPG